MDNNAHNITLTDSELGWVVIALWDSARLNREEGWYNIASTMRGLAERLADIRWAQESSTVGARV